MGHLSLFLAFALLTPFAAQAQDNLWVQSWKSVPQLVKILRTVPEGQAVLERASAKDPGFASRIKLGSASFTESTFSRTYSLIDGQEQVSLHHDVTLNSGLNLADAVVDLAHELVHFTEKGMLDPYKAGFERAGFIRNGIEGDGGELAALAVECRVAWSLEGHYEGFPQHRLCERYRGAGNHFQREAARLDYYALGTAWFRRAGDDLKGLIPEISRHPSVFTSSYAGKPYPVALSEEYATTRSAACVNNQRKFDLIAAQSRPGRQPASKALAAESARLLDYERRYCVGMDLDSIDAIHAPLGGHSTVTSAPAAP